MKLATPNPKSERRLETEDRLLCFGKLESMKEPIPEKIRKRRNTVVQDLVSKDK